MVKKVSLGIQADNLAACSETRIDCKGTFLSNRGRKKELAQIFPKNSD